jgi:hypothetical protein
MDITRSLGLDLVPYEDPPEKLLPLQIFSETEYLDYIPRRIVFWIEVLKKRFMEEKMWKNILGYRFSTYGFADPDVEGEGDRFGIIVYANPVPDITDKTKFLTIGEFEFPIFIRRRIEIPHAPPKVHPVLGTAASWAESNRISPHLNNIGFLTAKHFLPSPQVGNLVQTTQGYGTIMDIGPDGIDAALIEPPQGVGPSIGNTLNPTMHIIPWTDVEFVGQSSGSVTTKIVHVTDTHGILSPHLPARVFLADAGLSGDSGALIVDLNTREGVGIYCGELRDLAGRREGYAQHLGQAVSSMDLTLYD